MRHYLSLACCLLLICIVGCNKNPSNAVSTSKIKMPKYSLAQWSFNRDLFGGKMNTQDFIRIAGEMKFEGVEYVSQFFQDKVEDFKYLDSLNAAAKKAGVKNLIIMIDRAGNLGASKTDERKTALENHKKWVLAAKYLGCSGIRVNAHGDGTDEEIADACVQSIGELAAFANTQGMGITIENHGGPSSRGDWLLALIKRLKNQNVGALADPDNWCYKREGGQIYSGKCIATYDRYQGLEELMPFARGMSLKAFDFDEMGNEPTMDYNRIAKIMVDAGYNGYLGIEYEGHALPSREGVEKTRMLGEKVWTKLISDSK